MSELYIIGIGDHHLTREQQELLKSCCLIVGTERMRELVRPFSASFSSITPLADAFAAIRASLAQGNVAVLASGDPLFYGIGKRIISEFPECHPRIYPALSSIQRACALFRMCWDDARVVSLHGRNRPHPAGVLLRAPKTLALTDAANSPDYISGLLLDYLQLIGAAELADQITVYVAEDLGLGTEKLFRGTLAEAASSSFSPLNIMALLVPAPIADQQFRFGLREDEINHSRGLITKNEIRAATIHQLRLPQHGVLWDIGGGSGSVSIEAARSNPGLTVYTVEHKPEEQANIKSNILRYGCFNVVPVAGRAPQALEGLPAPDVVFIGGSSGELGNIIRQASTLLPDGGRIVVNGVIAKTIEEAPRLMKENGLRVSSSRLSLTRCDEEGNITEYNPINIITGVK